MPVHITPVRLQVRKPVRLARTVKTCRKKLNTSLCFFATGIFLWKGILECVLTTPRTTMDTKKLSSIRWVRCAFFVFVVAKSQKIFELSIQWSTKNTTTTGTKKLSTVRCVRCAFFVFVVAKSQKIFELSPALRSFGFLSDKKVINFFQMFAELFQTQRTGSI